MPREKFVIICRDLLSGMVWAYGSIEAMCNHFENPLEVTSRRIHQLKEENGFPIEVDGCRISRLKVWSNSDVREDNPAIVE